MAPILRQGAPQRGLDEDQFPLGSKESASVTCNSLPLGARLGRAGGGRGSEGAWLSFDRRILIGPLCERGVASDATPPECNSPTGPLQRTAAARPGTSGGSERVCGVSVAVGLGGPWGPTKRVSPPRFAKPDPLGSPEHGTGPLPGLSQLLSSCLFQALGCWVGGGSPPWVSWGLPPCREKRSRRI